MQAPMDYSKKTIPELISLCNERGIRGCIGKKKAEIIAKLTENSDVTASAGGAGEPVLPTKLRMIDLFAGTGAFTHAFQGTGKVQCVFANDMVEWSKKLYDANFDHKLTLQDLNTVRVEDIPAHDILTGGFPCFVAGTRVLTLDGYKKIEDVSLEDKLLTHTGAYQAILNRQVKTGATELRRVDIKYHPHAIECTPEHPFYVRKRQKCWNNDTRTYNYSFTEPSWVEVSQITNEHYVGMTINNQANIPSFTINKKLNDTASEDITITLGSVEQWYMMGYFLGDGWVESTSKEDGRPTYNIRFAIANKDIDTVVPILQETLPITDKKTESGLSQRYGCSSIVWHTVLKEFGSYSHGKVIPEWVHSAPTNLIEAFLDGYASADGCIQPSSKGIVNHHISYTTTSSNIAFGIQRLYMKLGKLCSIDYTVRPSTCTIEGRTVNQLNTYRMRVVINLIEGHTSSYIKDNYAWLKVAGVESVTTEPQTVYNFEVEHDNSYCVENSIVHNCQPFSIAGKQEGFDDARSNVFWKILQIIDTHTPRAIILENVKNLVGHDEGRTFEVIKKNLTDRGYHLCFKVLNTANITGVPQHRERIYIVCLKDKAVADKFNLDFPSIPKQAISAMLQPTVADKYYYTDASSTWPLVSAEITKTDTVYQYRRVYVRENKSNECPTLTANMGGGGHNVPLVKDARGIRKLTPRECFNFQGFPASYVMSAGMSDTNLYKLAGNAVSVPVVKLIANRLVPLLESSGTGGSGGGGAGHA